MSRKASQPAHSQYGDRFLHSVFQIVWLWGQNPPRIPRQAARQTIIQFNSNLSDLIVTIEATSKSIFGNDSVHAPSRYPDRTPQPVWRPIHAPPQPSVKRRNRLPVATAIATGLHSQSHATRQFVGLAEMILSSKPMAEGPPFKTTRPPRRAPPSRGHPVAPAAGIEGPVPGMTGNPSAAPGQPCLRPSDGCARGESYRSEFGLSQSGSASVWPASGTA